MLISLRSQDLVLALWNVAAPANNFKRPRHVLARDRAVSLTCGASFGGRVIQLDLPHLRHYSHKAQGILQRFP